MSLLHIRHFAQIVEADLQFGDLTVLVGPQATGKSLVLQLLKFALDRTVITSQMRKNGLDWNQKDGHSLLATYLGEGYERSFRANTEINYDGRSLIDKGRLRSSGRDPRVFYVPAQRVMTFASGWPRPFSNFEPGDPFVVRQFSQDILEQFGRGLGRGGAPIFPQPDRLKAPMRRAIERAIFHGGQLILKSEGARRRLMIRYGDSTPDSPLVELPFFEWSAGQREFAPLLLGLYQLLPGGKVSSHRSYGWAIIEEPEMGLHPQAINAVMLLIFELLTRGYRVCISTHSPYILELIWAIKTLARSKSRHRISALQKAIAIEPGNMNVFARNLLTKNFRAYALTTDEKERHSCTDISSLDLESGDPIAAGWGGITSFSSLVSRSVARGV